MNYKRELKNELLEIYGKEPESLDDLAHCCINVIDHNLKNTNNRVVGFAWNVTHTDRVSNTHSCPIDGVENFRCEQDKPRGYPGYSGRVWIRYAKDPISWGSAPFEKTLTYPGAGGRGAYGGIWSCIATATWESRRINELKYPMPACYSWDYRFYIDDFEGIECYRNWLILQDKQHEPHQFEWQDPETIAADKEFIEKYRQYKANLI